MSYKLKDRRRSSTKTLKSFKDQDLWRCVEQLKERLGDVIESNSKFNDEYYLLPWLKRHQFKLDRAEATIREAVEWRKANNIENLAHVDVRTFGQLAEECPFYFGSYDKTGQPVFTIDGDRISDADALIKKYGKQEIIRYIYYTFAINEKVMYDHIQDVRRAKSQGQRRDSRTLERSTSNESESVDLGVKGIGSCGSMETDNGVGCVLIFSFKNFSIWNAKSRNAISIISDAAKVGANYFPIFATTCFVLNMNRFLTMLVKLINTIIGSPFYELKCFDQDKAKWRAALLEEIEIEELPIVLGGNKVPTK